MKTRILSLSMSGSGGGNQNVCNESIPAMVKEWASCCAQEGVPSNAISIPKLADFSVHLLRVGLAWHKIGIYYSVISAFWNLIIFMKLLIILSSLN